MSGITLSPASRCTFGGHGTFPLRYGWLKKAVDAVAKSPIAFAGDEALVILGVGKNMVRAIKHWGLTAGVLEEIRDHGRQAGVSVTDLGKHLLFDKGWDPYLEDPASTWTIHWLIVSNLTRAAVWHLTFTVYSEAEFTRERLSEWVASRLRHASLEVPGSVVDREVDCLIRTYLATLDLRSQDDVTDCPLSDLGLLERASEEDNRFRFCVGAKKSLPAEVVGFALLDYFSHAAQSQRTFTVEDCLYGPGSPGQVFKLDELTLRNRIEDLSNRFHGRIHVAESAGNAQVFFDGSLDKMEVLGAYYAQ